MMNAVLLLGNPRYAIRSILLKLLLFFLLTTYYLLLTPSAFAQSSSSGSATVPSALNAAPYLSPQSPNYATMAIYNFGHAVSCILIGQSPISPCLEYRIYQDAQGMVRSVPYLSSTNTSNGVLGVSLSMIGTMISTPPIQSSEFIANLGDQIGIKSANAQVGGSGSQVLSPIFKLWEVSRNIAYLAMIIIFIVVGFMVMFRQKLNPQTVVSIQMALPGLVIGLVMITFSYFIASLISDVAFVGTNVVSYYFSLAQGGTTPNLTLNSKPEKSPTNPRPDTEQNLLSIFSRYTGIINWTNTTDALVGIWPYLEDPTKGKTFVIGVADFDPAKALTMLAAMIAVQFILPFGSLGGGLGQFIAGSVAAGVTIKDPIDVVGYSLSWVAMIVLIYSMFRLLLRLIQSFLNIIFLTIASPFYFLIVALPGRQSLIPNWFFNMLCNVLAFPAVFAVFYFVAYIMDYKNDPYFVVTGSTALANGATFPLLGGFKLSFLNALVAFGALVATPSIPDIICRAVGRPGQLGGVAAGAISGAIAAGQRYQGQVSSGASGFANTVGPLKDHPGYHYIDTEKRWATDHDPLHGAKPGRINIARANIDKFLRGGTGGNPPPTGNS